MKYFIHKSLVFLKEALSERGEASAKRLVLFWLLILFTAELIVNAIGKQRVLDTTLQEQLFDALTGAFLAVTGVGLYNSYKDIKFKQADSNKAVGAPTPPPDTVITDKPAA
jgi:hypothetical protein